MTARPTTLSAVADYLAARPESPFYKPLGEFLDEFYEFEGDRTQMLAKEPNAKITVEIAAFLAASAEYLSLIYDLPIPNWVVKDRYFLDHAFYPTNCGRGMEVLATVESPVSFRRRCIFVYGTPLSRKLGPVPVSRS